MWAALCLLLAAVVAAASGALPAMVSPHIVDGNTLQLLARSNASALYAIANTGYVVAPLLVRLSGTRKQIGYDYAALLHAQTADAFGTFMDSLFSGVQQLELRAFLDFLWDKALVKHTPAAFLAELVGMAQWHSEHPGPAVRSDQVAIWFYTIANMPADRQNIVAMLEDELEPADWPAWLKAGINDLIAQLEKIKWGCDAYGVWGSRTAPATVRTSRNLDWNHNTGIDKYKLVTVYDGIEGSQHRYATLGFAVGLGALAGMSHAGVSVSEMNLDNDQVTFRGVPFPLRLRMVLESAATLQQAMTVWNATNNTNSFNFLIGSAADGAAYALETIRGFTQQYGANSAIERDATYQCDGTACHGWTNQTGAVRIGAPLPDAVWRSNHAMSPTIMRTQEPLFNDTVFRYRLQHDLIAALTGTPITDTLAVSIVATLGTKGVNFLSCDPANFLHHGENVMSIAYTLQQGAGYFFVAWEQGKGANAVWSPAACNPYVRVDFAKVLASKL